MQPYRFRRDNADRDLGSRDRRGRGAQLREPAVGKKKVKFTQHCEVTLVLDMLGRIRPKSAGRKIEIGVSKACCEWCCEYTNLITSAYPQHSILVRASSGKRLDGWTMPPNGPKSVAEQMARLIEEKVDNVIWKVNHRHRSDSNELSSFATGVEADGQVTAKKKGFLPESGRLTIENLGCTYLTIR